MPRDTMSLAPPPVEGLRPKPEAPTTLAEAMDALHAAMDYPAFPGEHAIDNAVDLVNEATRRILRLPRVPWEHTRVITTLDNALATPQVVLARTLEKAAAGKIRTVYIGIQWAADNEFVWDYSNQPLQALAMHRVALDTVIQGVVSQGSPPDTTISPGA